MIIFKTIALLRQYLEKQKSTGKSVGFVPTMGALHEGHLSLVRLGKATNEVMVVSIFVNPTQFNDPKDFEKYPVTIDQDCLLLEKVEADILFLPSVSEMYPNGPKPSKHYDLGKLETLLEGAFRPGHFQGVCQVVERLLEIVRPDELLIGQKDFQQCMVLKKLVSIMGIPTKVSISPTLREADGLAMSSRNMRLHPDERQVASQIFRELSNIKENITTVSISAAKELATKNLLAAGFKKVDYVEIAAVNTLEPLAAFDPAIKTVALIAAFMGDVRLIDNILLN